MRITATLFACFYSLSVIGYGIEVHYCLGQVKDVNHALIGTSCCCDSDGQISAMDCCEEDAFFVQLEDEHRQAAKAHCDAPFAKETDQQFHLQAYWNVTQSLFAEDSPNAPPDKAYIRNCSLVLYA